MGILETREPNYYSLQTSQEQDSVKMKVFVLMIALVFASNSAKACRFDSNCSGGRPKCLIFQQSSSPSRCVSVSAYNAYNGQQWDLNYEKRQQWDLDGEWSM